jgi:hypothetical protein
MHEEVRTQVGIWRIVLREKLMVSGLPQHQCGASLMLDAVENRGSWHVRSFTRSRGGGRTEQPLDDILQLVV